MKRLNLKPLHDVFNDGFLEFGYDTTKRLHGKKIGEEFLSKGTLAYQLMSARDQDYELAGMMGATLDLKVKTPFPPTFLRVKRSSLKAVIDNKKYDVIKVDWDSNKRYLYFYLQTVGVGV